MKTLVVPDSHEKIDKLKRILVKYETSDIDQVVFLGDFLDSFDGLTQATFDTVYWLRDNTDNPKYKFLFGNHDMHYAYPLNEMICSGFDKRKLQIVRENLSSNHWNKFGLMHWVDGWLLSHAGLHPHLLHPVKGFAQEVLQEMEEKCLYELRYCQTVTALIKCGQGRGGNASVGGVTWLDWNTEFEPISEVKQICGHTPYNIVRTKKAERSINHCLDTGLNDIAIIEDGKVEFIGVCDI